MSFREYGHSHFSPYISLLSHSSDWLQDFKFHIHSGVVWLTPLCYWNEDSTYIKWWTFLGTLVQGTCSFQVPKHTVNEWEIWIWKIWNKLFCAELESLTLGFMSARLTRTKANLGNSSQYEDPDEWFCTLCLPQKTMNAPSLSLFSLGPKQKCIYFRKQFCLVLKFVSSGGRKT